MKDEIDTIVDSMMESPMIKSLRGQLEWLSGELRDEPEMIINRSLLMDEDTTKGFMEKLSEAGSIDKYLDTLIKELREAKIKRAVQEWEAKGRPDFFRVYEDGIIIFTIVRLSGDEYAVVQCNKIIRLPDGYLIEDGKIIPQPPELPFISLPPVRIKE